MVFEIFNQTDRQMQTYRQTNTNKQTDRQTDILMMIAILCTLAGSEVIADRNM